MKLIIKNKESKKKTASTCYDFTRLLRLTLGKNRFKTKVVNKSLNSSWGRESSFWVEDLFKDFVVSNQERIMAISIAVLSEAE